MSLPLNQREEMLRIRWMQSKEKYAGDKIEQIGSRALEILKEQLDKIKKTVSSGSEQDLEWLLLGSLKPIFIGCGGTLGAMIENGKVVCELELIVWYDSTRNEGSRYFRVMPELLDEKEGINPKFIEEFKSAFRGYYVECDNRFQTCPKTN
jgi:hypothetical protein